MKIAFNILKIYVKIRENGALSLNWALVFVIRGHYNDENIN